MANYLTTLRGTLAAGTVSEIFSHSLSVTSQATPAVVADDLKNAWQNTWSSIGPVLASHFPPSVVYLEATCAQILDPVTGRLSAAFHSQMDTPLPGVNVTGSLPTQVSLAVSLDAGVRDNGAPLRGRFYLPGPARDAVNSTDGLLVTGAQDDILAAMTSFFNALSSQGHSPAVWSRVLGAVQPITRHRVGNRLDTIRRRRNSAPEFYVEA